MDPSLLNSKHKGGVCRVWLSTSDVSEAVDLIHPVNNTLSCMCFDERLTPDCSTQVTVALTGDLDAGALESTASSNRSGFTTRTESSGFG